VGSVIVLFIWHWANRRSYSETTPGDGRNF
jgi:hypothetical protein